MILETIEKIESRPIKKMYVDDALINDSLHKKFGKNSVLRASALLDESTAIERHNQIGGHRK